MKTVFIVLGVLVLLLIGGWFVYRAWAATATATWDAVTMNEDGTPCTDLAGYRLYYSTTSRVYNNVVATTNPRVVVSGLGDGLWYFCVTAYDTSGNESAQSEEKTKNIRVPPAVPNFRSVE